MKGLDLYTEVVNWDEMRRLQVAFLRAGIPDQDLVQDAAFFRLVQVCPPAWHQTHHYRVEFFYRMLPRTGRVVVAIWGSTNACSGDIWKQFGEGELKTFPLSDILVYKLWYQKILGMKVHHPLNLVPYVKQEAEDELERLFGLAALQA